MINYLKKKINNIFSKNKIRQLSSKEINDREIIEAVRIESARKHRTYGNCFMYSVERYGNDIKEAFNILFTGQRTNEDDILYLKEAPSCLKSDPFMLKQQIAINKNHYPCFMSEEEKNEYRGFHHYELH